MKSLQILLTALIMTATLLGACAPVVQPDPTEPSPSEDPATPTADSLPEAAIGSLAYIMDPQADPEALRSLAHSNNAFALDLYQTIRDNEGNLIYSPYSLFQALLMVSAGAEGATASQMASVLGVDLADPALHNLMNALNKALTTRPDYLSPEINPLVINIANAVWAQKNFHFEPAFLDTLSANYNAGLKLVDFSNPDEAKALINLWVATQTNDKIKELIPDGVLTDMTRMVLTNAIYFNAAWKNRFDANATADGSFSLPDGSRVNVPFMHASFMTSAVVSDRLTAVTLPYEGGNFAMSVIMPLTDFAEYESNLTVTELEQVLTALRESNADVDLSMPSFKAQSSFALADHLAELGMVDAFDGMKADFSRMTGEPNLVISSVLHQATIDVNEDGTEAAAATAISMNLTSMPAESYSITLDKPFIYVIIEVSTNTIVFMGRVVNPSA